MYALDSCVYMCTLIIVCFLSPQGFGGKVEAGESVEAAALRELHEEAGIHASDATKRGIIRFEFEGDPVALQVHVFKATQFTGPRRLPRPRHLPPPLNQKLLPIRNCGRERRNAAGVV